MRPILFSCLGCDVRSAPFFAGLGALSAYLYFRLRRRSLGLSLEDFWNLMLALMLGVFLGGVALYAALYGPGPARNLGRVLSGNGVAGGSFFGVFWGAAAAAFLFCRRRRLAFAPVADALGAAAALGLVFMRIGCLLNGCCHGRPTRLFFGVVFLDARSRVPRSLLGVPLHPSQVYEAVGASLIFLLLRRTALPRGRGPAPGTAFLLFVALYASLRFATDFVRGSDPGLIRLGGLSTAQLMALLSLVAAVAVWARRRRSA